MKHCPDSHFNFLRAEEAMEVQDDDWMRRVHPHLLLDALWKSRTYGLLFDCYVVVSICVFVLMSCPACSSLHLCLNAGASYVFLSP